jgi:hypothetical protein
MMLLVGCATAQARRDARLRSELDGFRFHEPLSTVWPVALHVLAGHGIQLVGHDREVAGQAPAGILERIAGGGVESAKTDDGLIAETIEDNTSFGGTVQYRVEGFDTGSGTCRVVFTVIQRIWERLDEHEARDVRMELELVQRLEPAEAARMARAAGGS